MFFLILLIVKSLYAIDIDVQDYGAYVDDDIDDYYNIQQAIKELDKTKNGKLIFHKGTYDIKQHKINITISEKLDINSNVLLLNENILDQENNISNFTFKNYTSLTIEGNGAIFNVDGDWVRTADYQIFTRGKNHTYSFQNAIGFEIIDSHNVIIRNLELNGNADKTIKLADTEGFSSGIIIGGSNYVTLDNILIHHYQNDGLYLYATKKNGSIYKSKFITVRNSHFLHNARQGCSIVGAMKVFFDSCSFSYTGQTGLYGGHFPQGGVDVEPHEYVTGNGYIHFKNCTFTNNLGFAYIGSNYVTTPFPVTFESCTFTQNIGIYKYAAVVPASKKTIFSNCSFSNIALWPNYAGKYQNAHIYVSLNNCYFNSNNSKQMTLLSIDNNNLELYIKNTEFYFKDDRTEQQPIGHRFYITNNKKSIFDNCNIYMSSLEYQMYLKYYKQKFILNGTTLIKTKFQPKSSPTFQSDNKKFNIIMYNDIIINY